MKNIKPYDETLAVLSIAHSKDLELELAESLLGTISHGLPKYMHAFHIFLAACNIVVFQTFLLYGTIYFFYLYFSLSFCFFFSIFPIIFSFTMSDNMIQIHQSVLFLIANFSLKVGLCCKYSIWGEYLHNLKFPNNIIL